jgi:hypothetical protein
MTKSNDTGCGKKVCQTGKPPKTIEWLSDNGICYTAAETRTFANEL